MIWVTYDFVNMPENLTTTYNIVPNGTYFISTRIMAWQTFGKQIISKGKLYEFKKRLKNINTQHIIYAHCGLILTYVLSSRSFSHINLSTYVRGKYPHMGPKILVSVLINYLYFKTLKHPPFFLIVMSIWFC